MLIKGRNNACNLRMAAVASIVVGFVTAGTVTSLISITIGLCLLILTSEE